jgi:hypothetical protein
MSKRHNSKNLLAKTILFSTAALGALFLPNQGYAQSLGDEDSIGMETILVTARRRTESLQDVPFAITAFDREMIERRNITELEDVARFTAGFAFEDFDGGNASPVIRGQTTLRTNALEQNVATFLDGIYMPRSWLVDLGTANVNRIEIVKGPQSARYGRNAFSGAINYVPLKAGGDTDIRLNATISCSFVWPMIIRNLMVAGAMIIRMQMQVLAQARTAASAAITQKPIQPMFSSRPHRNCPWKPATMALIVKMKHARHGGLIPPLALAIAALSKGMAISVCSAVNCRKPGTAPPSNRADMVARHKAISLRLRLPMTSPTL